MESDALPKCTDDFVVILFYRYVRIEHPEEELKKQRSLCERLALSGRMIIAEEGINATLEGTTGNIEQYSIEMRADPRFADIHWKRSVGTGNAFPKLKIKVRPEIVSLHLDEDIDPNQITGKRLAPDELKQWYESGKDFVVVDMRNDYEHRVGRFKDSILSPLQNFRDLPQKIDKIENLKSKTILTVCTGGVRCEKASGFLVREGFTDVYQLDGGIVSYMEKYPGQEFEGTLYTFDNRITMDFDSPEQHRVVGTCDFCENKTEAFHNCNNPDCNAKVLVCATCLNNREGKVFCSNECRYEVTNLQRIDNEQATNLL